MTKAELEQIIDRYLEGKATQDEVRIVEKFYQKMAYQRTEWSEDKKETGERLYRKITQRIEREPSRLRYQISIAAEIGRASCREEQSARQQRHDHAREAEEDHAAEARAR